MALYSSLGDRMKAYEAPQTQIYAFKGQPLIVRLDGKGFHKFTKGLKRPFDERLTMIMQELTKFLVDISHATIGYTQSDEITLVLNESCSPDNASDYIYGGRFFKINSILAARASVRFNSLVEKYLPEKAGLEAVFDCRSFSVPSLMEAFNALVWRQQDAVKNAKAMAAQSQFSHKSLQNLSGADMVKKLLDEANIDFNGYPEAFRLGTFARRVKLEKPLEDEVVQRLMKAGLPVPTEPVIRTEIQTFHVDLSSIQAKTNFVLYGEDA